MTTPLITHAMARTIASDWNGGCRSPLATLATTGAILDTEALLSEITSNLITLDVGKVRRPLLALYKYVKRNGYRPPMPGWHLLWDDRTPVDIEMC
jgi:hypothetical protein